MRVGPRGDFDKLSLPLYLRKTREAILYHNEALCILHQETFRYANILLLYQILVDTLNERVPPSDRGLRQRNQALRLVLQGGTLGVLVK